MSDLPTYDDDQDGSMRLEMAHCEACGDTGIAGTYFDKAGNYRRISCTCPKGLRRHNGRARLTSLKRKVTP